VNILLLVVTAVIAVPRPAPRHTFSIVAYDPARQEWGVGTASRVLAVGAGVPWAKAKVGAVATQALSNTTYGPRGLELLADNKTAAEAVKLLTDADAGRERRQLGIVDAQGNAAAFTGRKCGAWAGEKIGKHHVCLGNLLRGPEVVEAMGAAFEKTKGSLAERIVAALEAGEAAGGDKRGKQSAAVLVVREKGGYLGFDDRAIDLRVDDHPQPVQELARILAIELRGAPSASAKIVQQPSPMVENTRTHRRLTEQRPKGQRHELRLGTLFLPETLPAGGVPVFVHFHGATWIPEIAAEKNKVAVIAINIGSGSAVYAKPFADAGAFGELLDEAANKSGRRFSSIHLSAWSAGYGAVRSILKQPEHYGRVRSVLLLDGLHARYVSGKPGPLESKLVDEDLAVFVKLAHDAAAGKKRFALAHTAIFPGTYASTTETADYLLAQLKLKRQPVLRWGPMGTQILGEAAQGGFQVLSFAGNSAPDHVDLLHALPELLGDVVE
jgi:uncharacterized Ntn-hydrolase superfamily protein